MADLKSLVQLYAQVKPIDTSKYFTNPFGSMSEFLRLVGAPIRSLYRGYKKFEKWADLSTPKPAQPVAKPLPEVNLRVSMQNAGGYPLTGAEIQRVITERQLGVEKLPQPQEVESTTNEDTVSTITSSKPEEVISKGSGLFAGNGFANMQSFVARKNWLLDAKNADYIKALGFDASNYKGTAQQNQRLLAMLEAQKVNLAAEEEENEEILRTKLEPTLANKISVAPAIAKVQTRLPYTDELLQKHAASPEFIKHTMDYSPDEFNRLMSIKTGAPNPYSLKYSRLDPALEAYGSYRGYLNTHKLGGNINYQKIFK